MFIVLSFSPSVRMRVRWISVDESFQKEFFFDLILPTSIVDIPPGLLCDLVNESLFDLNIDWEFSSFWMVLFVADIIPLCVSLSFVSCSHM